MSSRCSARWGLNVVETEEASEDEERREEADEEADLDGSELVGVQRVIPAKPTAKASTEQADDPVRMYLREMGSVGLLSREDEIAIAKRIEAGREAIIAGLCESPLTFQAIIIWRDELNEGKVLLRDIIDLEARCGHLSPPPISNQFVTAVILTDLSSDALQISRINRK
jgi:RNA polymerase primary sigma factor